MSISVIFDKYSEQTLTKLNKEIKPGLFQSCNWVAFQEKLRGRSIGPIMIIKHNGRMIAYAALIVHSLQARQKYVYINRAPICTPESKNILTDPENFKTLHGELSTWCKERNILYFRIAFPWSHNLNKPDSDLISFDKNLKQLGAKQAPNQHQPEFTQILDISLEDEALLAQMKPKGRYNIKVARKHSIVIKQTDDVDSFYELVKSTTTRNKFSGYGREYYRKFLETLETASLYLAYYDDIPVAGIIVVYDNETAIYYYGASDSQYRKYMAPYLIHWIAIHDAQKQGCKNYDLFGIAPPNKKNHPWQGITNFKKKFGGTTHQYLKTYDFPVKKASYLLFRKLHSLKKKLRR